MATPWTTHDLDAQVRIAAFRFLEEQVQLHGDVLPRTLLIQGFYFQGQRVSLISRQGIFTPRVCQYPLSFYTTPPDMRNPRPYEDELGDDRRLRTIFG
jgi:putative restriction endonuclease